MEWSASEFVAHDKGASWYVLLSGATIVVAAILYLVTRDRFTVGIVVVMGAVLAIAAASKPRVLTCRLDAKGIVLGTKRYPYAQYKSFTVQEEGPFASIVLLPMKRFGLPLSMYLAPDIEHKALEVLSSYLPLEPGKPDMLDRLMRYLRF